MEPLTEGKTLHAKKKRSNVRPKTSPPAPTPIPVMYQKVKKRIIHNQDLHSQVSLCNIMLASLLFGFICIIVAAKIHFLALSIVYGASIFISLGAIDLLPKFVKVNINHVRKMKYEILVLLFVLFLGPIMTLFILTTLLLPPKKKKEEVSDETK